MNPIKSSLKKIVTIDTVHQYISKAYHAKYPGSRQYWERRYEQGGNSGAGSYGRLAEFKANMIENFIDKHNIQDVIEWGCGDGNQISLTEFPSYIGLDISPTAIQMCKNKFGNDKSKSFFIYDSELCIDNHEIFQAELGLSLDVIYHLTEDNIYQKYMEDLFSSSEKYVIIYAANTTKYDVTADHVKHRKFTDWVENNTTDWELTKVIDNEYPYDPSNPESTSWSDFHIFKNI
jgi:hypothetical protein